MLDQTLLLNMYYIAPIDLVGWGISLVLVSTTEVATSSNYELLDESAKDILLREMKRNFNAILKVRGFQI